MDGVPGPLGKRVPRHVVYQVDLFYAEVGFVTNHLRWMAVQAVLVTTRKWLKLASHHVQVSECFPKQWLISIFSQKVKISASTNSFLQLFIHVQWMVVLAYGQLGQLAVKHVVLVPSLEADCATTLFLPIKVKIAAVTSIKPKAVNWHHALVGNFKRVMSSAMRIVNFQTCSGALYEKVFRNVTPVPTKY